MKKNEKFSLILKNNNNDYFKNNNYNTSKNREKKKINLYKVKYNNSTGSNIINGNLNFTQEGLLNTNIKLNKINTIFNYKNNIINLSKKPIQNRISLNKNNINEKKMNSNIYNNTIKDNASYINIKNEKDNNDIIYNDDTDRSSMETIKKILYSTDNKKKVKKNKNNNNFIKSTQLSGLPSLKDMLNNFNISNVNKNGNLTPLKEINIPNEIDNNYFKKINFINKNRSTNENIFKKINNEFKPYKRREGLNSMKLIKTSIINDKTNISENKNLNSINNMLNNYKYLVKKLYNNMDISNKNKNSVENYNSKIFQNKKIYLSRNSNIDTNHNLEDLNNIKISNNLTNKDNINEKDKTYNENITNNSINNNVIYLKAKIKILTEEIKHKNAVIREYSILAGNSKIKFEQLIEHNNKIIENIKRESKKRIMLYKNKILILEKEKQNILNKYNENKKYSEFLEYLFFEKENLNEPDKNGNTNLDKNNQIKKLEYIIKKLMNDIANMRTDIKNKNEDNDKLRNIIFRFKKSINSASYKTMNNSGKNILTNFNLNSNANTIELSKYEKLLKKMGEENMKNKKISKNLSQKSNIILNRIFDLNTNGKKK